MSADSGYGVRLQGSRATVTGAENSLESINTFELDDGCIVIIKSNLSEYVLDKLSVAAPSGDDIVAPAQGGPGRWFKYPTGGGATFERLSHEWFVDGDTAVALADQTGSIAAPFATIQQGVDDAAVLAEPVRLIVQSGTYPEDVVITGGNIEICGQGRAEDLLIESITWTTANGASLRLERLSTTDPFTVLEGGGGQCALALHECDLVIDASNVDEQVFNIAISGEAPPSRAAGSGSFTSRIEGTIGSNFARACNTFFGAAGFTASQLICEDCDADPTAVFTFNQNGVALFNWTGAAPTTFATLAMTGQSECRVENCTITSDVTVVGADSTLNFLDCIINLLDVDPGDDSNATVRVSGTDAPGAGGPYRASVTTVDFHGGGETPNQLEFITTLIRLPVVIEAWDFVSEGCSIPDSFDLTVVGPQGGVVHDVVEMGVTPIGIDATSVEMDAATAMLWLEQAGAVTGELRILGSVTFTATANLNVAAATAATVTFAVLGIQGTHNASLNLEDADDFIAVMSNVIPADDQLNVVFRNFDPANAHDAAVTIQGQFGTPF